MRNKLALLLAIVLAAGLGWYFASPSIAMNGLRAAAMEGNKRGLEERIDFPSVRVSLKSQMHAKLAAETVEQKDNPFAALGSMFVMGMIDRMVDSLVTPDGLAALIKAGKMKSDGEAKPAPSNQAADWTIARSGFDRFEATPKGVEGSVPTLIFKRNGLSWQLAEIHLSDDEVVAGAIE